ncbi:acetylglutamate kinase [Cohnella zeiphila]|uniref:Acetylglutamate kinase n=1 Tax=Cohnella zeiphila TaxID=2761120 RepID=A0A7X0SRA1_9BACL|nr:acetylglutamate kinase [Cohnella zeiphila]MBB6734641.1 acetylglutamate kinase [Cohnella zeiphila]
MLRDYSNAARMWTPSAVALNQNLRKLWADHVYWTRLTVNSIAGKLPDEQATTARLLRNPDDFGAALAPLYGPAIAAAAASLLRDHLTIAADLVKALRDGRSATAAALQTRWYRNADSIAELLGRINPYWTVDEWRRMMYDHLRLLTGEASARLAGDYAKNVATSDPIVAQALGMADTMTSGILRQFPAAFSH